jgi:hypothetical protein
MFIVQVKTAAINVLEEMAVVLARRKWVEFVVFGFERESEMESAASIFGSSECERAVVVEAFEIVAPIGAVDRAEKAALIRRFFRLLAANERVRAARVVADARTDVRLVEQEPLEAIQTLTLFVVLDSRISNARVFEIAFAIRKRVFPQIF